MPVADFSPEAKLSRGSDVPKLRLEKDAKARIVVLDKSPVYRWQHRLSKIKLVGGSPDKETKTRRNGEEYEVYAEEFVGTVACTGDLEVLQDRGLDPDGCPTCKATRDYPEAFKNPSRRFAIQVFEYGCKPGTADVSSPFGGQVLVWNFTERRFSELVDIASEFDNLQEHDLILGPCTNATFQNYDILASPKAAWLETDENKAWTVAAFQENKFTEAQLLDTCARISEQRFMIEDAEAVSSRWEYVMDWEKQGGRMSQSGGLDETASQEDTKDVGDALDDLFQSASPTDNTDMPPETADAADVAEAKGEEIGGIGDLDDLLNP